MFKPCVLIPVYNHEHAIGAVVQAVLKCKVPCILVDDDYKGKVKDGKLGDIAPTILTLMGVPIPKEMTGQVLIEK